MPDAPTTSDGVSSAFCRRASDGQPIGATIGADIPTIFIPSRADEHDEIAHGRRDSVGVSRCGGGHVADRQAERADVDRRQYLLLAQFVMTLASACGHG